MVVIAAAIIVTVVLFVFVFAGEGDEPSNTPIDEARGERSARSACDEFDGFVAIVERNGSADDANRSLDAMVNAASEAVRFDPQWTQLASGTQTLRLAFDEDDPEATRLALQLVRTSCASL